MMPEHISKDSRAQKSNYFNDNHSQLPHSLRSNGTRLTQIFAGRLRAAGFKQVTLYRL